MTADTAQGTLLTSVNHVLGEEGQIHGPDITDSLGTPASSVFGVIQRKRTLLGSSSVHMEERRPSGARHPIQALDQDRRRAWDFVWAF